MDFVLYFAAMAMPVVGAFLLMLSAYSAIRVVIARTADRGDELTVVKPRVKLDLEFSGGQSSGRSPPWLMLAVIGAVLLYLGLSTARYLQNPFATPLRYYDDTPADTSTDPATEVPSDAQPAPAPGEAPAPLR